MANHRIDFVPFHHGIARWIIPMGLLMWEAAYPPAADSMHLCNRIIRFGRLSPGVLPPQDKPLMCADHAQRKGHGQLLDPNIHKLPTEAARCNRHGGDGYSPQQTEYRECEIHPVMLQCHSWLRNHWCLRKYQHSHCLICQNVREEADAAEWEIVAFDLFLQCCARLR